MHEYDIALKSVLRRLTGRVLAELTGFEIQRWLNVRVAGSVGETADWRVWSISNSRVRMTRFG